MINTSDFSKRLKIVLEYYGLSASAFAEKIQVQRSSISHLLSGRNKPSLDFVLKVLNTFKEVELYWLLNGKGDFPKSLNKDMSTESKKTAPTLFSQDLEESLFKNNSKETDNDGIPQKKVISNIERIVIFYLDGTFKEYKN